MMYDDSFIFVEDYSDHGISIDTDGSEEQRTICPQCTGDRRKSYKKDLAVNTEKGVWVCHHCGWSGKLKKKYDGHNVYNNQYRKTNNHETKFKIQENKMKNRQETITDIQPMYNLFPLPDAIKQKIWDERKITKEALAAFNVQLRPATGNMPEALAFPRTRHRKVVGIKYRTHEKAFFQEKGSQPSWYNFDGALAAAENGEDTLIIVEGEFDALAFYDAGFKNVVSVPNGAPPEKANNLDLSTRQKIILSC
ncbi:MAG: toprim domain-containing protein [Bacteroidota bacterium]